MPTGNRTHAEWVRGVVSDYEGPLVQYAARLLCDTEQARDVVQDVFMRLCAQRQCDVDGHLAQWLFTVCRNRASDVRRKERHMATVSEVETPVSPDPPPPEAAEQKESAARMLGLLEKLPANQQEVLRLKFQNGFSYRQIAEVTELSVSNVGYLIHTGLKTLRGKLNPEPSVADSLKGATP